MATLTQTATIARKVIRYGLYALVLIIIGRIIYNFGVQIYTYLFPPKPPPPTVKFGPLPTIPFPEITVGSESITYALETVDGNLPSFSEKENVYFMPKTETDIQSLETAKSRAGSLGFNPEGKQIAETIPNVYLFENRRNPSILTMNIITGIFSISYDINENPSILQEQPVEPSDAIKFTRSFLERAGYLPDDLKESPTEYELLQIQGNEFVPAVSLSDTDVTKVNIFRKELGMEEDIPSVTQNMPEANVWFLVTNKRQKTIIAAEYHYYPMDQEKSSTYPIITSQQAWEKLNAGQAFVANRGDKDKTDVTIREVYLAYYDPGIYTPYYQPVIVFTGDDDFHAYVPAITEEFYGKAESE